jgi:hypothetical protein
VAVSYYLDSLTWGLGWAAAIAALVGAILELRRNLVRGLMLVAVPLALFVYLSAQSRYFGRWLLPAYPALAMLAAAAIGQASALVERRTAALKGDRPGLQAPGTSYPGHLIAVGVATALTAVVLVQPLAADIRSAQVLGRDDTRQQARDWIEAHYPPERGRRSSRRCRAAGSGRIPRATRRAGSLAARSRTAGPSGAGRTSTPAASASAPSTSPAWWHGPTAASGHRRTRTVLDPGVIDDYRLYGYCLVVTVDTVRARALQTGDRDARAYYDRLERESKVVRTFSPYDAGAKPVPFNFDLSFNYYPPEYNRPGPTVQIRRLGDCRQATGPPIVRIPRAREPAPFGNVSPAQPNAPSC